MSFNGGKSQLNFSFTQTSTDDALINRCKQAQTWTSKDGTAGPDHDLFVFDTDGYPTAIPASGSGSTGVETVFYIPSQALKPGNYYVVWTGGGTIGFPGCSFVSGSALNNTTTGSYSTLINVNSQVRILWDISAVGTDGSHIHDVAFIHEDDKPAWDAGEKNWSGRLLSSLRYLNPGVIRFLDWQDMNHSNITTWATRKASTHYGFTAHEIRPSLWAGTVTNSGNDYTGSFGAAGPSDKQLSHIKFPANATVTDHAVNISAANPCVIDFGAPCPFAVNDLISISGQQYPPPPITQYKKFFVVGVSGNTCTISATSGGTAISTLGADNSGGPFNAMPTVRYRLNSSDTFRPLLNLAGVPSRANNNQIPLSGRIGTAMYDAALDAWLLYGGTADVAWVGINNGVPFELMFDLCAKVGAHPWFVCPAYAADPNSDLMGQVATYHRDNVMPGNPWMIPRFEGPNELWNTIFFQTAYAIQKCYADFAILGNFDEWYGKVMSLMGQAIQAVYGGALDGTKFSIVSSTQNATGTAPTQNNTRMTSPAWVAQTSSAQAAHNWITHHSTGGYINSFTMFLGNSTIINGFNYLITNAGNPTAQMVNLDAYGSDFALQADNVVTNFAKPLFDWAKTFTNRDGFAIQSYGYEGGPADGLTVSGNVTVGVTTPVITKAANAVVTVNPATTTLFGSSPSDSIPNGHPIVAGMAVVLSGVLGMTQINNASMFNSLVITGGNPDIPFTGAATVGQVFWFSESGGNPAPFGPNMPSGNVDGNFYYVVSVVAGVSLRISRTKGGAAITPSGSSGGHTILFAATGWKVLSVSGSTITLDCDSTSFSTHTSGGTVTVVNGDVYMNLMLTKVRFSNTLATSMLRYYNNWLAAGATFPPQYSYALSTNLLAYGAAYEVIGSQGQLWGFLDTIYGTNIGGSAGSDPLTPYALVIHNFNAPASSGIAAFSVVQDSSRYQTRMIGY